MLKKIFCVCMVSIFALVLALPSVAQTGKEDYKAQTDALKQEMSKVKSQYLEARKATRAAAMQNFKALGATAEEKAARKKILEEAKQKEAQLLDAYKKSKDDLKGKEKQLKEALKKAEQVKGKAQEKIREGTREMEKEEKAMQKGMGKGKGKW